MVEETNSEEGNTQTTGIKFLVGTQSLRDTLACMKRRENFFKIVVKVNVEVFWKNVLIKTLGDNRLKI